MSHKNCPKCDADISDSYQEYDPSVGLNNPGWYCEACNEFVEQESYEPDWDEYGP